VTVPIIYNDVNDIRAFEDYLSSDGGDGELLNCFKYDNADPRSMQFMHFCSEDGVGTEQIDVNPSMVAKKTLEEFLQDCQDQLSGCHLMTSEELTTDYTSQNVEF